MVAAIVFDLDGVLIDSEPVWEEVRRAFVQKNGGEWSAELQRRMMGVNTREWATYLSEELRGRIAPSDVAKLVLERMQRRYARDLPLMPGAAAAVTRLVTRW